MKQTAQGQTKNIEPEQKKYIKPVSSRRVKSEVILPVICEILESGRQARLTVTGTSMLPFLRENTDSVVLAKIAYQDIKFLDIVLIKRLNGQYILHRVVRKKVNTIYIAGDFQCWIEGPIYQDQVLAKVISVYRKDHCTECTGILWKLLSGIWMLTLPLRYFVQKGIGFFRRVNVWIHSHKP